MTDVDADRPPATDGLRDDVAQRVCAILAEVLGRPEVVTLITEDTDILRDLGLDSVQTINFLLALEDEFDVELHFEDLSYEQVQSLPQICEFVLAALSVES